MGGLYDPSNLILRAVPEPLGTRFRARAAAEGWSMEALILRLMEDYVEGRAVPSGEPPSWDGGYPPGDE